MWSAAPLACGRCLSRANLRPCRARRGISVTLQRWKRTQAPLSRAGSGILFLWFLPWWCMHAQVRAAQGLPTWRALADEKWVFDVASFHAVLAGAFRAGVAGPPARLPPRSTEPVLRVRLRRCAGPSPLGAGIYCPIALASRRGRGRPAPGLRNNCSALRPSGFSRGAGGVFTFGGPPPPAGGSPGGRSGTGGGAHCRAGASSAPAAPSSRSSRRWRTRWPSWSSRGPVF